MTATQRRKAVEVARDVLLQLRLKRIEANSGTYLIVHGALNRNSQESFQKTFAKNESVTCTVCAIGACYISYINRFNRVTNTQACAAGVTSMLGTLTEVFSYDQLRLMEAVFESGFVGDEPQWFHALVNEYYDSDCESVGTPAHERITTLIEEFYNRYPDDDKRLRAIMINVIRNNGEFRLPLRMR